MISKLKNLFNKYRMEVNNAGWLLIEKVFNLLTGFIFFLMLARYLGPVLLGQYSIILSLLFLLTPISNLGLNGIVTKEFLNSKQDQQTIFGTTIGIRFVGSVIAALIALAIVYTGWLSITPEPILVVSVLALANISRSLGVIELFYKSQSNNKPIVIVRMLVLSLSTSIKIFGFYLNWSLEHFLLFVGIEWILTHVGYYFLLGFTHKPLLDWNFSITYGKTLLRRSLWLVLSGLASYVYLKTDILMIGYLVGNEQAGYYSAATRLSEIWYFIPMIVTTVFYPKLQRLGQSNSVEYKRLLAGILKLLLTISFLIASLTTLFSDYIITFFYGDNYNAASSLLCIQAWILNFVFIRAVYSSWLLVEAHYKYSLFSHLSGAVVNVALNLLLIPIYGGEGAAAATLAAFITSSVLVVFAFQKTRSFSILTGQVVMQLLMLPIKNMKPK
jgi:O-antigen/teichoic acid export membrane protein